MKTIRISQDFTFPEVPPLIWEVPPLIWEVPLLIWEVPPLIWCKLRIKPISPAKLELGLSLAINFPGWVGEIVAEPMRNWLRSLCVTGCGAYVSVG